MLKIGEPETALVHEGKLVKNGGSISRAFKKVRDSKHGYQVWADGQSFSLPSTEPLPAGGR